MSQNLPVGTSVVLKNNVEFKVPPPPPPPPPPLYKAYEKDTIIYNKNTGRYLGKVKASSDSKQKTVMVFDYLGNIPYNKNKIDGSNINPRSNGNYNKYETDNIVYNLEDRIIGKVTAKNNNKKKPTVLVKKTSAFLSQKYRKNKIKKQPTKPTKPIKKYNTYTIGEEVSTKKNTTKVFGIVDENSNNKKNKVKLKISGISNKIDVPKSNITKYVKPLISTYNTYEINDKVKSKKTGIFFGDVIKKSTSTEPTVNLKTKNSIKVTVNKSNFKIYNNDNQLFKNKLNIYSNNNDVLEKNGYSFIIRNNIFYLLINDNKEAIEFFKSSNNNLNNARKIIKNSSSKLIKISELRFFKPEENYIKIDGVQYNVKKIELDSNDDLEFSFILVDGSSIKIKNSNKIEIGKKINDSHININDIVVYNKKNYKINKILGSDLYIIRPKNGTGLEQIVYKSQLTLKNAPQITERTIAKLISTGASNAKKAITSVFSTKTGKLFDRYVTNTFENKLYFLPSDAISKYGGNLTLHVYDCGKKTLKEIFDEIKSGRMNNIEIDKLDLKVFNINKVRPANDIKIGDSVITKEGKKKTVKLIIKTGVTFGLNNNSAEKKENIEKISFKETQSFISKVTKITYGNEKSPENISKLIQQQRQKKVSRT